MLDLHAHVVLEGVLGRAGTYGPELLDDPVCPTFRVGGYTLEGVRYRGSAFMDVQVRLEAMERLGITWQLLSPNPLTYLNHIEAEVASEFARWHNEEMAAVVAADPARLGGAAQLPTQDPPAAAAELRRSVQELGLIAAYMGTDSGTGADRVELDDPRMDEVWATAVELDVPVFIHPAPPGIDSDLADTRVRRFDADLWLSFAFEETLAIATLVFGGVLDRHPSLDVCVSHGGGALVALIGKMRSAATRRAWVPENLRESGALDAVLRRLWYDAHVSDDRVLALLADVVGPNRLVGGTNFAGWDQPEAPVSSAAMDANARRLLRLGP
ncbi:MAG: amidohydrolase [Actinomycetia bacterium]|nr:amidohydrolase [Actinomycetes bacterium]